MIKPVLCGTGLYTPPYAITNAELVSTFNQYVDDYNQKYHADINNGKLSALQPSSASFIEKASGIKQRFVMEKEGILNPSIMSPRIAERPNDQPSIQAEMALHAARQALDNAKLPAEAIDAVFVACSNMQRPYPAMAIEIQNLLQLEGYGYDLNVACSSATFGIRAATDAILAGHARRVLVVNPEICTAHLNFRDRESHFIFGDACTAAIIGREEDACGQHRYQIIATELKTQFSSNIRNNFGFMNHTAPEGVGLPDKLFVQQGRKVFKEVVPIVVNVITNHLHTEQLQASDIKRYWLHQANLSMNQLIAKKLLGCEASRQQVPVTLDQYANTSSAGVLINFHLNHEDLTSGDYGVICSFGAGYSVGSVIVRKL